MLRTERVVDDSLVTKPLKANGRTSRDDEVTFLALAQLSLVEYDRARKAEAKRLGIGIATLDAEVKSRRAPRATTTNDGHGQTPLLCDPQP